MNESHATDPRGLALCAWVAGILGLTALPLGGCGSCPELSTVIPISQEDHDVLLTQYGSEGIPLEECARLCRVDDATGATTASGSGGGAGEGGGAQVFERITTCTLTTIEVSQPALLCTGASLCGGAGRRPEGLRPPRFRAFDASTLGAHFAEMARLEAASVTAFTRLERELVVHGAPPSLARRARVAAREEARHARVTRALARRFGARPARPEVRPPRPRSLEALAEDNAVEGCAGEALGALVLAHAATRAVDPDVRAALARIAIDEAAHAALSFDVDAWAQTRLSPAARGAHARALARRLGRLEKGAAAPVHPSLARLAGMPSPSEARALVLRVATLCAG